MLISVIEKEKPVLFAPAYGINTRQAREMWSRCGRLRDDPERVVSITLARLALVDGVGGQDALLPLHRLVVGLRILLADTNPVATHMAVEAAIKQGYILYAHGAARSDNLAGQEKRIDHFFSCKNLLPCNLFLCNVFHESLSNEVEEKEVLKTDPLARTLLASPLGATGVGECPCPHGQGLGTGGVGSRQ